MNRYFNIAKKNKRGNIKLIADRATEQITLHTGYINLIAEAKLPDGVTAISDYLFYNCEELATVNTGANIASVGNYAFSGCVVLSSVDVSSARSIGVYAFEECDALTSLSISSAVEYIGEGFLFAATNMKTVTVGEGNTRYSTETGALINLSDMRLMYMPSCTEITSYTVPEGVKSISSYAFNNCLALEEVVLSESLVSIGSYAFNICDNLSRIVLPDTPETEMCDFPEGITEIGGHAFYNTKFKKNLPAGFTVVGDGILIAFKPYTDSTGNFIDGDGAKVVTRIVDKGGYSVNEILGVSVTVPESVKNISSAFAYTSDVVEVILPATVTSLSDYAFFHAIALESVDLSAAKITYLPYSVFADSARLSSVKLPSTLTSVGEMVFAGDAALKTVTLPESLTAIGHSMFFECTGLESVYIPASVKSIGDYAFSRTKSLTTFVIPDTIESIGNYVFAESGLTELTVPPISVGEYILLECVSLVKLTVDCGKSGKMPQSLTLFLLALFL